MSFQRKLMDVFEQISLLVALVPESLFSVNYFLLAQGDDIQYLTQVITTEHCLFCVKCICNGQQDIVKLVHAHDSYMFYTVLHSIRTLSQPIYAQWALHVSYHMLIT